ncbi:sensor histidine kinase [Taibaiella koreensis]|uniref:sensor histidine kinase n=1 Tax=Taibaiella koreensis TaxID=1268548 RepID=UPI000E59E047|nr:7TM diverse intracellular signaling domain-containing protein [Taibaiella koreensis]
MNLRPFWVLCLLLFNIVKGYSQSALLNDSSAQILIGKSLQLYKPEKDMPVTEVRHARFQSSATAIPNMELSTHDVWARFTVTNPGKHTEHLLKVANATLDEVELYVFAGEQLTDSILISKQQPFGNRKYKDPNYIFDVHVLPGTTQTFYLRIRSKMPIILPVYLSQPQQQLIETAKDYLFSGTYVGIVIIMVVYNFFLFLSIRDKSYIYYVFYVLGAGFTQVGLKGFTFQFLWPGAPGFENISIVLFACISGIAALLFTLAFLEIRKHFRRLHLLIWAFIGSFCLALAFLPVNANQAFQVMQLATMVSSIGVVLLSLYIVIKKPAIASARFFLVAWSVLILGSVIFILKDFSIVPYNLGTTYAVQIASAIEMALLSFGLANRINTLKREKEQSRLAALRIAKENSRIIKEQNVVLEQKVKKRTEELESKNQEIATTLADLQQTQMQLVEAEKMASLGQLTAGIAHEINNPINFVTGNIGPLKRDVDVLFQLINLQEELSTRNISDDEKMQEANRFKEEQDFDYLKTEIGHLLRGINEGATRTAEIVRSLRIFSRLDEAELKLADINEGLESTIVIVNNLLGHTKVIKHYGNLPLVHCYPGKLNQVFLNIISNALFAIGEKFGESPGGELTVTTSFADDQAFIAIGDNGTGMTEETRRKVFDPFFTTKDVGKGTGLGMSIAFTTIQKHQGSISVTSEPGKGSIFSMQIPLNAIGNLT